MGPRHGRERTSRTTHESESLSDATERIPGLDADLGTPERAAEPLLTIGVLANEPVELDLDAGQPATLDERLRPLSHRIHERSIESSELGDEVLASHANGPRASMRNGSYVR